MADRFPERTRSRCLTESEVQAFYAFAAEIGVSTDETRLVTLAADPEALHGIRLHAVERA